MEWFRERPFDFNGVGGGAGRFYEEKEVGPGYEEKIAKMTASKNSQDQTDPNIVNMSICSKMIF